MQVKEEKMIDWTKIKNPAIADRVREEGRFMMQRCHFGVQGIAKTEQDVKLALDRLMQTGFKPMAFDTEMNFVPMLKELTQGEINLHCAVSYPLGRMTLKKKMQDLETLLKWEFWMYVYVLTGRQFFPTDIRMWKEKRLLL